MRGALKVYYEMTKEELESSFESWNLMAKVDKLKEGEVSEKVEEHLYHIKKAMERICESGV